MADDVTIKFGADIADLKGKVDEVLGVFGKLTSKFAEMAAIVGGGVAFKKFIDETVQLNGEGLKLSKMLGIAGEEAGTLNTALHAIGADVETYTGAFIHFNRQLRNNSDEMKNMGVDINALRSGQKSSNEVFVESLSIFSKYKPGIDQTQAAMKLFGRSVEDVYKLQRLANDVTEGTAERLGKTRDELNATLTPLQKYNANMETAAEKNRALNLTITQEGIAASRKYKEAMVDVEDVLKGVAKTIGEGVMPHFTDMAKRLASVGPTIVDATKPAVATLVNVWKTLGEIVGTVWSTIRTILNLFGDSWQQVFGRDGPGAMEIFNNALKIIEIAFIGFRIAFELSASMLKTGLVLLGEYFVRFANVADRALHFDFAGAKAAWRAGVAEHNRILADGMGDMVRIAAKGAADMDKVANRSTAIPVATPMGAPKGGTMTMDLKTKTGKDANTLAAELALLKAQQEAEKALELEYLKEAQSMYDEAFKNGLISTKEYYDAKLAIEIRALDSSLGAKRKELLDAQKAEADARAKMASAPVAERNKFEAQAIKFQTDQVKLIGEINVLEARRIDTVRQIGAAYADVKRQVDANLQAVATARAKTTADNEIAVEREALAQKKAMRQISAQDAFNAEKQLEDKSYAAVVANLAARRAAIFGSADEIKQKQAELDAEAENAETQHQLRLTQIDDAAIQERNALVLSAQAAIEGSFTTLFASIGDATKTLKQKLQDFATSIEKIFAELAAKQLAKQIFGGLTGDGSGAGWLGTMLNSFGFPSFDVGTDFVPHDMLAMIHKGEKITPAAQNFSGDAGGSTINISQNFAISGATDTRTQSQLAAAAGRGVRSALARGG